VYWGHVFDLLGSRDIIGHAIIRFSVFLLYFPVFSHISRHFYWWSFGAKPLSLIVCEIRNGECDAMVEVHQHIKGYFCALNSMVIKNRKYLTTKK